MPMKRSAVAILGRVATSLALAGAPAVGLATLSGCFIFGSPGPSAVGQGQQYTSGEPTYDEFFQGLYEVQVSMGKAPEDEKKVRAAFAEEVGAEEDSSANLVAKQVKKVADKIAEGGTGLKVDVKGADGDDPEDVEVNVHVAGKDLDDRGKAFVKAIEETLEAEGKVATKLRKAKRIIKKLEEDLTQLESGVDANMTFRKSTGKKSEVKKNLADARTLIPLMQTRADDVAGAAQKFVEQVQEAASTDHGQFAAPAAPVPAEGVTLEGDKAKGDKPKSDGDKPKGDKPRGEGGSKPPPPPSDFEP
jgi:hypothetical protein